jgi:hypothetical protein
MRSNIDGAVATLERLQGWAKQKAEDIELGSRRSKTTAS